MRIVSKFLFTFLLLASHSLLAFNNDTTKSIKENSITRYFSLDQFAHNDSTSSLDSDFNSFDRYIPKTLLGNTGLVNHPLTYSRNSDLGFNFTQDPFPEYFYSPEKLKLYNTRTPYTDLFYLMGSKREQFFKSTFSVNPKKNWNITADLFRIKSLGSYTRQSTDNNAFALSTNYRSKNNRYWVAGGVIYNSAHSYENGGVLSDSSFTGTGALDAELMEVNLYTAERITKNRSVFVKQILNLGPKSVDTSSGKGLIMPGSRFILSSLLEDTFQKYLNDGSDILSGYYQHVYFDSTQTFDSTYFNKIENSLEWRRIDNLRRRGLKDMLGLSLSVKHQIPYTKQKSIDTTLSNLIGAAELFNTYSNHLLWWNVGAAYVVNGYNEGDYTASLDIKKAIKDSSTCLIVKLKSALQAPDYMYSRFRTNHFFWENHFDKTEQNRAELSFEMKKYHLNIDLAYTNYKNVLYFDNYALARQFNGQISVFSAHLKKDLSLYNWHLDNDITYQYVPDSMVIRLPQLVLDHSLYYQNDVLKGAAIVKVGLSVFYSTGYYANAFMPASGVFYLQDNKKYGNYPFIDFFLSAKIKMAKILFMIDHVNAGLTGNNYVLTPNYPYRGRTFKIGVSWCFFD